jgi:hypothetical protein
MSETLDTIKAAWPMLKGAITSGQLFRPQCTLVEPDDDILCEYDVEVPTSEGFSLTCMRKYFPRSSPRRNLFRNSTLVSNKSSILVIAIRSPDETFCCNTLATDNC